MLQEATENSMDQGHPSHGGMKQKPSSLPF